MDTLDDLKGDNVDWRVLITPLMLKCDFPFPKLNLCPDYDHRVNNYQITCFVLF